MWKNKKKDTRFLFHIIICHNQMEDVEKEKRRFFSVLFALLVCMFVDGWSGYFEGNIFIQVNEQ